MSLALQQVQVRKSRALQNRLNTHFNSTDKVCGWQHGCWMVTRNTRQILETIASVTPSSVQYERKLRKAGSMNRFVQQLIERENATGLYGEGDPMWFNTSQSEASDTLSDNLRGVYFTTSKGDFIAVVNGDTMRDSDPVVLSVDDSIFDLLGDARLHCSCRDCSRSSDSTYHGYKRGRRFIRIDLEETDPEYKIEYYGRDNTRVEPFLPELHASLLSVSSPEQLLALDCIPQDTIVCIGDKTLCCDCQDGWLETD